jgi:LemA protein
VLRDVPALWVFATAAVAALLLLFLLVQYNRMVSLRNRCREAWSNVDAELLRRHQLIPNLVAAVSAAARHERAAVEAVARARERAMLGHKDLPAVQGAENDLSRAVGRLLAVAEAYPNLKASANFLALQEELGVTEDRIQAARRFYNGNVRDYRDQTRQFPGVLVAQAFGFGEVPFFELEAAAARQAPRVAVGA